MPSNRVADGRCGRAQHRRRRRRRASMRPPRRRPTPRLTDRRRRRRWSCPTWPRWRTSALDLAAGISSIVERSARWSSASRSSAGTSTTSASIARRLSHRRMCARRSRRTVHGSDRTLRTVATAQRAAMSAPRLPAVPPLTNTPPAVAGNPARSAIHRSAWFSAKMAPPPSSHDPAYTLDAPTTRSNRIAASVGAAGTNDKNRG